MNSSPRRVCPRRWGRPGDLSSVLPGAQAAGPPRTCQGHCPGLCSASHGAALRSQSPFPDTGRVRPVSIAPGREGGQLSPQYRPRTVSGSLEATPRPAGPLGTPLSPPQCQARTRAMEAGGPEGGCGAGARAGQRVHVGAQNPSRPPDGQCDARPDLRPFACGCVWEHRALTGPTAWTRGLRSAAPPPGPGPSPRHSPQVRRRPAAF